MLGNPDRDLFEEFEQTGKSLAALVRGPRRSSALAWPKLGRPTIACDAWPTICATSHSASTKIGLSARELGSIATLAARLGLGGPLTPASALEARLKTIAPVSLLRIGRLALEWQELNDEQRCTALGVPTPSKAATFAEMDTLILEHLNDTWQTANSLAARIMAETVGFFLLPTR